MFFDPFDEFPHSVSKIENKAISDGMGGSKNEWAPIGEPVNVFIDTPTTKEQLYAMQMNSTLDRFMYYPFGLTFTKDSRIRFENVDYEIAGEGEDQGGMHEIMRIPLKKVTA